MDYDVLILGGGIIGCAVAYELSKYSLNIALIEKDYDIADDVSIINAAIVYDGAETKDTLIAKLEQMGNKMVDELISKFNIPFKRCGSLIISGNEMQEKMLMEMYHRARKRGIEDVFILEGKDVYEMEPNLNVKVNKALYSKNTGVISPYDLAISYGEVAFDNGVSFRLEEEVIDIEKISKGYRVITNKNKFTCKMVVNTTPGNNYSIGISGNEESKEEKSYLKYYLLEKDFKEDFSKVLFTLNDKNDSIYTIPTVQGNMVIAVSTKEDIDYGCGIKKADSLVSSIDNESVNTYYESQLYDDIMLIDDSSIDKGYIKVTGNHYGEVTMTPYIAKMVCETIVNNVNCKPKKDFIDKRREVYRFKELTDDERNKLIKIDKRYGKIICQCQMVTEGEVIDAIRRPLGARTVEGIKRRTGVTLGSCRGANCIDKIVTILARETNKNITEIVKDSKNSRIMLSRIKEFDENIKMFPSGSKEGILTTLVRIKGAAVTVVPVKSSRPISKDLWIECSKALSRLYVGAPIKIGEIVCKNILNTGVDIICTKNVKKKE